MDPLHVLSAWAALVVAGLVFLTVVACSDDRRGAGGLGVAVVTGLVVAPPFAAAAAVLAGAALVTRRWPRLSDPLGVCSGVTACTPGVVLAAAATPLAGAVTRARHQRR
jgi:hypothetical protein